MVVLSIITFIIQLLAFLLLLLGFNLFGKFYGTSYFIYSFQRILLNLVFTVIDYSEAPLRSRSSIVYGTSACRLFSITYNPSHFATQECHSLQELRLGQKFSRAYRYSTPVVQCGLQSSPKLVKTSRRSAFNGYVVIQGVHWYIWRALNHRKTIVRDVCPFCVTAGMIYSSLLQMKRLERKFLNPVGKVMICEGVSVAVFHYWHAVIISTSICGDQYTALSTCVALCKYFLLSSLQYRVWFVVYRCYKIILRYSDP